MDNQLWVEPVGDIIVVRVRGIPNEALLRECQERVLLLLKESGRRRILYDALELIALPVQVAQRRPIRLTWKRGELKMPPGPPGPDAAAAPG